MHDVSDDTPRTALPDQLRIIAWVDPIADRLGFPPHHPYSELLWLPIIGPASTLAWRRLSGMLENTPDGFDLDVAQLAQDLGLGTGTGGHAPISRTLRRVAQFGLAVFVDAGTYAVRRRIPPISTGQRRRVSPQLQRLHTALLASHDDERLRREQVERTSVRRGA